MKLYFCLQVLITIAIAAITIEKGSNDGNTSKLIDDQWTNTTKDGQEEKRLQPTIPSVNGTYDLVGRACDCECKCCLQMTRSCEHFYVCVETRIPRHSTCLGGLKFNPNIENCDLPQNFQCPSRPTIPPTTRCPTSQGLFQYPGDCSLYIQCDNFVPFLHYCAANLHFCETCDPARCEYPVIANCTAEDGKKNNIRKSRSIVEDTELIDKSYESRSVLKCPTKFGFYPVPTNPRRFYKCLNGIPTREIECPRGLVYNPATSSCSKI